MTRVAILRCVSISRDMAGNASRRCVRSRQRELSLTVIEGRRFPRGRTMALSAIVIEVVGCVVRVLDAGVSGVVTGVAIRRSIRISGSVTGNTGNRSVCAC